MSLIEYKRLGDIINFKRGYDLPTQDRTKGSYPILSSSGISGYHSEYKVKGEGVVIGRYGTLGEPYYINEAYWPHNTTLYVTDFKGNYPKYVYYLLKCLGKIKTSDKSAVPGVNRNELHEMVVPCAIKSYQEKIAAVLSALDAKIDVNNRINTELEKLAKTIYDYWFVQFDFPNEDGKPYKASGGKMVYNDQLKRHIPAGWEVGKVKNIAKNIRNTIQGSDLKNNLDYIGLEHIPRKSIVLDSWDSQPDLSSTKSMFCRGNILFGKLRPYFHKVGVAFIDGICSTEILVIDSKNKSSFSFLLMNLSSDRFIEYVSSAMEGTRMPRTKWRFMENFSLVIPPDYLLHKFNDLTQPSLRQMGKNVHENQQLTQLRDWLLPLLMNGQVRVE